MSTKTEQVLTQQNKILECIATGLSRSFGESVKQVILYQFELATKSNSEELVSDPQAFAGFLERFFGRWGSRIVEEKIVEEIKREFGLGTERQITFESAVKAAQLSQGRQLAGTP